MLDSTALVPTARDQNRPTGQDRASLVETLAALGPDNMQRRQAIESHSGPLTAIGGGVIGDAGLMWHQTGSCAIGAGRLQVKAPR